MHEANTTRYRGRVRTGCFTCRACKVRCDERKPVCQRCIRLDKNCKYPGKKSALSRPTPASSASKLISPLDPLQHTGQVQKSAPLLLPCSYSVESSSGSRTSDTWHGNPLQHSEIEDNSPSKNAQGYDGTPSTELSRLIAHDIYLCTTNDFLAAEQGIQQRSLDYFRDFIESPFVTPYDPANWAIWKTHVLSHASHSTLLTSAIMATKALHQARVNSLSHKISLSLYTAARSDFGSLFVDGMDHVDDESVFSIAFLLSFVEMLAPEDISSGVFLVSKGPFVAYLEKWCGNDTAHSPLCLRLVIWLLASHAAARRSGGRGLLSAHIFRLFSDLYTTSNYDYSPSLPYSSDVSFITITLAKLSAPLFSLWVKLQLLSAKIADLSHYHRSRGTQRDQEEATLLINELTSKIVQIWNSCPAEIHYPPSELRSQFSKAIAEPLIVLSMMCRLTYHTELVEAARNLSNADFGSSAIRHHLTCIRNIVTSFVNSFDDRNESWRPPSAFLRPLFLLAIESKVEGDTAWAVSLLRKMKDTVYCSDFFATFAEGLAQEQAHKGRRVTTRWWCWQVFGTSPPYL